MIVDPAVAPLMADCVLPVMVDTATFTGAVVVRTRLAVEVCEPTVAVEPEVMMVDTPIT